MTIKTARSSKLLTRQAAWKLAHPDAVQAHHAVRRAIRRGELQRQPCADCGHPYAEAHHEDYSRPLDVVWLCRRDHLKRHPRKILRKAVQPDPTLTILPSSADGRSDGVALQVRRRPGDGSARAAALPQTAVRHIAGHPRLAKGVR